MKIKKQELKKIVIEEFIKIQKLLNEKRKVEKLLKENSYDNTDDLDGVDDDESGLDEMLGMGVSDTVRRGAGNRMSPRNRRKYQTNESKLRKEIQKQITEDYSTDDSLKKKVNEYGFRKNHSTYGAKGDPRILTLKYDATCSETGKRLKAGEQAVYYPNDKAFFGTDTKQAEEFRNWKADMDMGYDY